MPQAMEQKGRAGMMVLESYQILHERGLDCSDAADVQSTDDYMAAKREEQKCH